MGILDYLNAPSTNNSDITPAAPTPGILDSIFMATKKLPGQVVGGAVDLTNMISGGYANIVDIARGKLITRSIGEGLVPKPLGGTQSINESFGIPSESSGPAEDYTGAILGGLSPLMFIRTLPNTITRAGQYLSDTAKISAATPAGKELNLIVGARSAGKSDAAIEEARAAQAVGMTSMRRTFSETGVYIGPLDGKARSVIDDSKSVINPDAIVPSPKGGNVTEMKPGPNGNGFNLEDVLGHPELYDIYPELKDVAVISKPDMKVGTATTYNSPAGSRIEMGPQGSVEQFQTTLLHETQHVIQHLEGFSSGASPSAFLPSPKFYDSLRNVQTATLALKTGLADKYGLKVGDIESLAANPDLPSSVTADPNFQLYLRTRRAQVVAMDVQTQAVEKYKSVAGEAEAFSVEKAYTVGTQTGRPTSSFFPLDLYDKSLNALIPSPYDSKILTNPGSSTVSASIPIDLSATRNKKAIDFENWQNGAGNVDDIFSSLYPATLSKGNVGAYLGKRAEVIEVGSGNRVVLKDETGQVHYGVPASELKSYGIKK